MNFVLIANAWSAGEQNPTSKHRIALELAHRGHRVLWIEGSGMRTPSLGSGSDRGRMLRKALAAAKGATPVGRMASGREEWPQEAQKAQKGERKNTQHSTLNSQRPTEERPQTIDHRPETRDCRPQTADRRTETAESGPLTSDFGLPASGNIWVLSPLLVPLPKFELVRRFNGWLCASLARRWCWKLGFGETVLINYVPVLAEAMRGFRGQGSGAPPAQSRQTCPGEASERSRMEQVMRNASQALSRALSGALSTRLATKLATRCLRGGGKCVYHCVDRWDAFAMYDSAMMAEMDARCCRYADVVIASSKDLLERCREKNPSTHLVTHGVDYEHFAKAVREERPQTADRRPQTTDLPPGPIVGFFGLLSEWVDQDLLIALARGLRTEIRGQRTENGSQTSRIPNPESRIPNPESRISNPESRIPNLESRIPSQSASIVLIGQADVDVSKLRAEPNIVLLGPKPFAELPDYIRHFDVGVIPFVVNELTAAVNPIKLREMLAAGCPVVSTALPEVVAYAGAGTVEIASDHESFVTAVRRFVENPPASAERAALSAGMAGETWVAKVDQILAAIDARSGS